MLSRKACRIVAEQLNEDFDLVYDVVQHQFSFIKDVMKDPKDTHDILINKLFRFKLKKRYGENKQYIYSSK